MVVCLERGSNDLHMVQLMPLPPHHLLLQQNPEWFILLIPAYPGCPGKKAIKRLFVCVCACVCDSTAQCYSSHCGKSVCVDVCCLLMQAAVVSGKKKSAVEQLHHVREELSHTEAECEEKRSRLQQAGTGDEVLKGDEVFSNQLTFVIVSHIT